MSTSIYGYPVALGTAVYGAAADTTGAGIMRRVVANNLLHYADSYAQVRVAASYPGATLTYNGATVGSVDASPTANQWYLLAGGVLGEWPLTQHLSGEAYALRIRLRGRTSNAAGTVSFRLVLCPIGRAFEYIDQSVDWVWTASGITSTSAAWLTGQTASANAFANRLVVDADTALSWVREVSAPESATVPRSIPQCLVALHIFGRTTNNTGMPQMYGAYAAEFVGA